MPRPAKRAMARGCWYRAALRAAAWPSAFGVWAIAAASSGYLGRDLEDLPAAGGEAPDGDPGRAHVRQFPGAGDRGPPVGELLADRWTWRGCPPLSPR